LKGRGKPAESKGRGRLAQVAAAESKGRGRPKKRACAGGRGGVREESNGHCEEGRRPGAVMGVRRRRKPVPAGRREDEGQSRRGRGELQ